VPLLKEAHRIHHHRPDHPDRYGDALVVCRLAGALALRGRAATAARLLSCFENLVEEIGVGSLEAWVATRNEVTLIAIRSHLDETAIAEAWEQGRALTADEAVRLALDS